MSWFFETRQRESEKNGSITANRFFGMWRVIVEGAEQTGPNAHRVWIDAFQHLKKLFPTKRIQRVILLGLGGGGEIKTIYEAFPGTTLTVLEYDSEMIALTKELKLYHPHPLPEIIVGDVKETLPQLSSSADLLIVDIFQGENPSPLLTDPTFIDSLSHALGIGGLLLINVFKRKEYLEYPKARFALIAKWQFLWNHLALFQKP